MPATSVLRRDSGGLQRPPWLHAVRTRSSVGIQDFNYHSRKALFNYYRLEIPIMVGLTTSINYLTSAGSCVSAVMGYTDEVSGSSDDSWSSLESLFKCIYLEFHRVYTAFLGLLGFRDIGA